MFAPTWFPCLQSIAVFSKSAYMIPLPFRRGQIPDLAVFRLVKQEGLLRSILHRWSSSRVCCDRMIFKALLWHLFDFDSEVIDIPRSCPLSIEWSEGCSGEGFSVPKVFTAESVLCRNSA